MEEALDLSFDRLMMMMMMMMIYIYIYTHTHTHTYTMWCWRRMEMISWTDLVRNEEVLLTVKEQRNILYEISKRLTGLITICVETAFYNGLLKER